MSALPAQTVRALSRHWIGRLSAYRLHQNDEHREAVIVEAVRYSGLRLETYLGDSAYWSEKPLIRRAAVLLYLVDRGALTRRVEGARVVFEVMPGAEEWVAEYPALAPYQAPTLELISALRREQGRWQHAAE